MMKYSDIPKYRKRAKKKKIKKADHKHEYYDVVAVYKEEDGYMNVFPGKVCSVCGKQERRSLFFTESSNIRSYRKLLLDIEDISELYPEHEVVIFKELW